MSNHPSSRLSDWLRISRISALPTAVSNILAAFLLAEGTWQPAVLVVSLVVSSSCLFVSGMILNDVFDYETDCRERPKRPLPSGQITIRQATVAAVALIVAGLVASAFAAIWSRSMLPMVIALALVICIYLYDGPLKSTVFAPVVMGSCRSLNFLLGASATTSIQDQSWLGFSQPVCWVAIALGIYICGVTLFAKRETAERQSKRRLGIASCLICIGLAGMAMLPIALPSEFSTDSRIVVFYPLLMVAISLPILRRLAVAVSRPTPKTVQNVIVVCLRSIIVLDAALSVLATTSTVIYGLVVIALLIPTFLLSRIVSKT